MMFLTELLLVAALFPSINYVGAESMSYPNNITLKENVFDVYWFVNTTEQRFYFKIVANTIGWASLAWTTNEGGEDMKNYDIALGGVRNGNVTYLKDYWSTSETKPTLDTNQNLKLTNAMESGGKTTLEFNRQADTGDSQQDTPLLMNNKIFLAWAIGREDAIDDTTFTKHPDKQGGGRGHTYVGYNMYTGQVIQPVTTPQTTTKQTGSSVVPSVVVLVVIQLAIIFLIK